MRYKYIIFKLKAACNLFTRRAAYFIIVCKKFKDATCLACYNWLIQFPHFFFQIRKLKLQIAVLQLASVELSILLLIRRAICERLVLEKSNLGHQHGGRYLFDSGILNGGYNVVSNFTDIQGSHAMAKIQRADFMSIKKLIAQPMKEAK